MKRKHISLHEQFDDNHQSHKQNTTRKKRYKCNACDKLFTSSNNLKNHIRTHTNEKPYKCDVCDKAFAKSSNLRLHKLIHSGDKPHKCNECDKTFTLLRHLKQHERTHTGEKPYKCTECHAVFTQQGTLQIHKRIHTGEKPYKCNVCDSIFRHSAGLIAHKRRHSGEKTYHCDLCDKAFVKSSHLKDHKRIHAKEKPYKCDECAQSFTKSNQLIVHQRIHSGEKPFACDECDARFTQSGHLYSHKQIHSGEKPFICLHCTKCFGRRQYLKKHIENHEKQKSYQYSCQFADNSTELFENNGLPCSIRCKTSLHLDYHIQRNHTIDGIASKFESETKLAKFFDQHNISYDRDWLNLISFKGCKNIESGSVSARPDFYLHAYSVKLKCIFLVGNDEFAHRHNYPCEFKRMFNIVQALQNVPEQKDIPVVYVRFNPHNFRIDKKYFDRKLELGHDLLLRTIDSFTDLRPGLNLIYVQYDMTNNQLEVFRDNDDYSRLLQPCVRAAVY